MSKTTTKAKSPMTPSTKKTIIISVICAVMVIILAVSLPLMLRQEASDDTNKPSTDTSTSQAYIKNGDFAYYDKDNTTFPKTADNWTKYTYKAPVSDSEHGFEKLDNEAHVIGGIIDVNEEVWETVATDLAAKGISGITNPGIHNDDLDTNVFMFATKEATNAAIVSTSFSVASQTSAKITVWVNTALITEGNATVAIQQYSSTGLSALDEFSYAKEFSVANAEGWQELNFYVFNRKASSQSVVVNVGIGNTYTGANAQGILFVDDITYTTVSANEYRNFVDNSEGVTFASRYGIIGEDATVAASEYASLVGFGSTVATEYTTTTYPTIAEAKVEGNAYSPFTSHDHFGIYKIENNGTVRTPVALELNTWNGQPIVVKSSADLKDHLHISFWARTHQNNVLAQGNVILQTLVDGEWTDLESGSFTSVVTSQDIAEDSNCGWAKYDIYLKPTTSADDGTTVRVLFALGNIKGYASTSNYTPNGALFVTTPFIEQISASDYSSASSGTYAKKVSLVGATASTSINNGSFSSVSTSNPNQPTSWQPVFAGDNLLYKDGKGNIRPEGLATSQSAVSGSIIRNNKGDVANGECAPKFDDSEQNYLKLTNNVATSYGYLSADINLSAHTVYAFSVLAKTTGNSAPFIYVVKNVEDRTTENAVMGKIESATATGDAATDTKFGMIASSEEGNGWTRYYVVIITGDETVTARVALFNGSIDGQTKQAGTVYYDNVSLTTIGSYTIDTAEYAEGDEDAPATNRDRIKFTTASGYSVFEELTTEEISSLVSANTNVNVSAEPDWEAMVEKALATDEEEDDEEETTTKNNVDVGLILSVVSSVALVGALLIVVVVRWFKKRNNQ